MKIFLQFLAILILYSSCTTTRNYLERPDEDRTFFDIIKRLNKKSTDEDATKALATVYNQVKERHLKKIVTYRNNSEITRWDKLNNEYAVLQNMYNAIDNSPAASKLVTPVSYSREIADMRKAAAEDYYQLGDNYFSNNTREDARLAYNAYKKAGTWVKDYKDSKEKMEDAFNSSIINVMINPIQDNSFFFNTGWGNMGYNYSNEYFQQNLVRDLGGRYATRYPAKFYTEMEARSNNVQPDWVVDLTLRNMDIPRPSVYSYSRNVSKQIEVNRDTAGKPIYQTVYATINIQRQSFIARAQMDVAIVDIASRRSITYDTYSDTYNWEEEIATFSGDRRALSNNDLAIIGRSSYNMPRREDILNELYRNIYPQVKNRISNEVDW